MVPSRPPPRDHGSPLLALPPKSTTTKHLFVTGGVASSLGKGLTASSLGALLKARGLRVTMQKLDPYLNVDPGTMNPFQHGEVFVTDDGAETDLDIGHYERFLDVNLMRLGQRHDRPGLLLGDRQGAAGRVPRRHRAGHPAHHQRDQVPHPAHGDRGRGRGDHGGRRHRRRHRVAALPGVRAAGPARGRPGQRLCDAHLTAPVHRPLRRAEDQADPALRGGAAQHRHPARRDRAARRPRRADLHQAQDLADVRRRRGGRGRRDRRPVDLRHPQGAAHRGPGRVRRPQAEPALQGRRLDAVGRPAGPGPPARARGEGRPRRQVHRPARRLPFGDRGAARPTASPTTPRSTSSG